ncbi:GntR family transcriptional regulator [Nocardia sp. NPDC052278]|uniref:GntR family transcriptional regulator n=1 Tax=unclassified Nocardia TaxID=2637762 RepID=UPI0036A6E7AD
MPHRETRVTPGRAELDSGDSRLPLHARLRDVLTTRIQAGEWNPSTALPAESALAAYYGVALGTMRRVLGELVDEGLLERQQGAGTFVRRASLDSSLFRFFRYGQPQEGIPSSRILNFRESVVPPGPAAALGLVTGAAALWLHRLRLRDEVPFLIEEIWLPLPRFAALVDVGADNLGDLLYPAYERHCDVVIAAAEEILIVDTASAGDALLLRCRRDEPLVVIERTARAHDGTSVEWRRSRGRAGDFRYRIEIK